MSKPSTTELAKRLELRLSAKLVAHTPLGDTEILNAHTIVAHLMPDIEALIAEKVREARIDELKSFVLPVKRFDEHGYSPDENAVGFNSAIQLVHNKRMDRIAALTPNTPKGE